MPFTVCVIGAGVNGLSAAVNILEQIPDVTVTIISDEFSPNTTGDGAAGFWEPFKPGDTPQELQDRWGDVTFHHLEKIFLTEESSQAGIGLVSGYHLYEKSNTEEDPSWKNTVYNYRRVPKEEVKRLFPKYSDAVYFTSLLCEGKKYLPWLMERFKRQGGRTMKKKIENIREVEQYDVVVNCTGIGARSLVNDAEVQPIRGQVIRVHAHWIKHFAITADAGHSSYVIPCANNVLLGGTTQVGNWNLKIDENDKKKIWEGCCKMYPSLKHAKLDYDWVGLRPSRTSVRLEKEIMNINGREIKVVHNYGHGGSGVTFHWGCAQDTTTLVSQLLGVKTRRTPTAKL